MSNKSGESRRIFLKEAMGAALIASTDPSLLDKSNMLGTLKQKDNMKLKKN